MEYLLVMSLSGSTMAVVYLLMRCFLWKKVSARMFYLLAKMAVLYYLIPLPFLKPLYKAVLRIFRRKTQTVAARIPLTWTNYAIHADEKLYVNIFARIQMTAVVVWLIGACILITRQLVKYVRASRRIAGYVEESMTDRHREVIDEFRERYGVKRPVVLYRCLDEEPTMTFGILKPVITCSKEPGSREAELLLRHEMVHIKRLDVLWKIFLELVTFLHWWNFIMWLLYRGFERVCECSCDETAMQGKSREEVKEYLRLLIEESREKKGTKRTLFRWKAGFRGNAKKINERMDNLMKNKKWNRFAACALVAALTFANSMTVFAYRDTLHVEMTEEAPQDDIEIQLDGDTYVFSFGEIGEEETQEVELLEQMEFRYDRQFTDEEGNIYPMSEEDLVEPHCDHDYVAGRSEIHRKLSGGGCEVRVYDAQRCSKCGYILQGALLSTHTYVTCPH